MTDPALGESNRPALSERKDLGESSGQLRTLTRATFASYFESELMPPGLPRVRLVVFAIVVLMFPATQIPMRAAVAYNAVSLKRPEILDLFMWPHKLLFITHAMVVTALVALVIWDNVFPDRRDAYIIGPLPIRPQTVVTARLLALCALMGLIACGSAAPSALFYGVVAGAFSPGGIPRSVIAHFLATMGASAFAFLLLLALQGILINMIPGRWIQRAMVLLQFVFLVASLEALLLMHPVVDALEKAMAPTGAASPSWMSWAPPAWFLGLYEVVSGTSRPVARFAIAAIVAIAVLLPLAFGLYAITYQRLTRRAIEERDSETVGGGVGREPALALLGSAMTRSTIASAVCRFTVLTLARSRKHRLLLTIFAGVGTTAAATSVLVPLSRHWRVASILTPEMILPIGLVFVFFLVVGLRTLFAIPAELSANWLFKLSDAEDARRHLRGASAAMISMGVLPVLLLLAPIHLFALGVRVTVIHSALILAAGFLLCEITLSRFRRVPFTSAYNAPATRARVMWPFWLMGFSVFSFTLSEIEALLLGRPMRLAILLAVVTSAAFAVRWWRERDFDGQTVMFDDGEQEDAPVTLELGRTVPDPVPSVD